MRLSLLLFVVACGSPRDQAPRQVDPPAAIPRVVPAVPDRPHPAPGIDLAGPPAVSDATRAPRRPAVPFDLAADRAIVKVHVPVPPSGGAIGFSFGDDRRGWVTRIPDARALPAVAYGHDRVYVSGGFQSVSFYALAATTGRVEWATTNLEDNGPTAAVIEGDDVLFNTESCTLFALDARTGKRRWHRYLGDPTLAQVAVTDGLVYAAHPVKNGDTGFRLSAFTVTAGAPVWSRAIDGELLATPVISGDSVYASTLAGTTYRFDHRTGKLRWAQRLHATTAPWIAGDELFVTRRNGGKEQQVVVATATGQVLREHWIAPGSSAYDVPGTNAQPATVWAFEGSRPVVDHGIHYVALGPDVVASDAKTGDTIWNRRYRTQRQGRVLGSVALAGSTLVVSSRDGKVFGLDVDTGFTLWSYDLGHTVTAEPIVAKGWLYASTTDGYVIALDVADKSLDGWHMFGGNPQKNGSAAPPPAPMPIEGRPQPSAAATSAATATPATKPEVVALVERADAAERQRVAIEERKKREAEIARKQPVVLDETCLSSVLCDPK